MFFGGHFEFLMHGLELARLIFLRQDSEESQLIWANSRIQPIAHRAISVISVPDLAPADRVRIKNSKWPPKHEVRGNLLFLF